jgi:transcriptional regulator with PAS, ATPase and Fis domain
MQNGEFRQDIYYSLAPFQIKLPPIRNRAEDIKTFVQMFLEKYGNLEGKDIIFDDEVTELLTGYSWPGNIRQIEKMISMIVNTQYSSKLLTVKDLPELIHEQLMSGTGAVCNLVQIEKKMIMQNLNAYGSSVDGKKKVAQELGISVATLYRKLHKYGIDEVKQYRALSD